MLSATWEREDGLNMRIVQCCIDSAGHRTEAVYRYVKPRQVRGVYATVGRAGVGRPIISAPSNRKQGQAPLPVKLFTVGVDEAKGILYSRLKEETPGPGYCHFPEGDGYEQEYFKQLTAEKRVIRYTKGFPKAEWIKTRARNEALDCRVQAHAALCLLNPLWKAVEKNLAPRLPFPEQAIAEPSDGTVARHPIGMVRLANSEQLRRIAARDSWVTRRRR
ncbi:MAG: phage terminase large subunit family protein [bacterium]|nr:phage terminase large subunit family protein [bacterium]